jgi:hypothetical protein
MNRTFTIDEDIIRRLILRREQDERGHERARAGHSTFRLWRGLLGTFTPEVTPRARWS